MEGVPFRQAHEEVGAAVREGRLEAPWGVDRSLAERDLVGGPNPRRVSARARAVARQAQSLAKWAKAHPPPLPM